MNLSFDGCLNFNKIAIRLYCNKNPKTCVYNIAFDGFVNNVSSVKCNCKSINIL